MPDMKSTIEKGTADGNVLRARLYGASDLPTGAATSAKQDTQITAEHAVQTAVEKIDDWDESDRCKVNPVVGQAGVAAGAGTRGDTTQRVTIATDDEAVTSLASILTALGGQAAQVQVEITRPANTTQYAANDAIADNAPSTTTHVMAGMARANGGSGRIVRACIKTDNVSWTTAVRLVIYKAAPAGGFIADNAAYDDKYADKASIVGQITFPAFSAMGTGAAGGIRAAVVEGLYIPYECGAGVSDLYFQIYIPSGTPTPASGQKFYLHLGIEQD